MPIPHSALPAPVENERFDHSRHTHAHHELAQDRAADFEGSVLHDEAMPLASSLSDGHVAISTPAHNYLVHSYNHPNPHAPHIPKGWADATVNGMYAAAEAPHLVVHGHAFVHPEDERHHPYWAKHLDRGIMPISLLNSHKVPPHVAERIRRESAKVAIMDYLTGYSTRGSSTVGIKVDPATGHATHLVATDNSHAFNYEDPATTHLAHLLKNSWYPMSHAGVYTDIQKEQALKGAIQWAVEHGPYIRKAFVANLHSIHDDELKMHLLSNFMKRYDSLHQMSHDYKLGARFADILNHKSVDAPGSVASKYSIEG